MWRGIIPALGQYSLCKEVFSTAGEFAGILGIAEGPAGALGILQVMHHGVEEAAVPVVQDRNKILILSSRNIVLFPYRLEFPDALL